MSELSEYERKEISQRRTQNLLMGANFLATAVNANRTKKLESAVNQLSTQVESQSQILDEINYSQSELLDENRRQTQIMESTRLALERTRLENEIQKATKQVVFELGIRIDEIEDLPTNIEKHFASTACLANFSETEIDYEHLTSIEDKKYLYDARKKLEAIGLDAIENVTEEELNDLTTIEDLKNKFSRVNELLDLSDTWRYDLKEISTKSDSNIADEFGFSQKRSIPFVWSAALLVLGIIIQGGTTDEHNYGLFLACLGGLGIFWRIITSGGIKKFFLMEGPSKEQIKNKVEAKREELKNNIIADVNEELKKFNNNREVEIEFDNLDAFTDSELKSITSEFEEVVKKYPYIQFKLS